MPETLNIELYYPLFLEKINLKESDMPPIQRSEMKKAFMGGVGTMLLIIRDKIPNAETEEDTIDMLQSLFDQVEKILDAPNQITMTTPPPSVKSRIFLTGFIQVFLVAVNTYLIARYWIAGVAVTSFFISYIWTFNVQKVAFGSHMDRIVYAAGAMAGSVVGLVLIHQLIPQS